MTTDSSLSLNRSGIPMTAESVRVRLVQASIIDSYLITLIAMGSFFCCLILSPSSLWTIRIGRLWMSAFIALTAPAFAPVLYRLLLTFLRRQSTFGENWLGLEEVSKEPARKWSTFRADLLIGCTVLILSQLFIYVVPVPDFVFCHSSNSSVHHQATALSQSAFPVVYTIILAFVLRFAKGRRFANRSNDTVSELNLSRRWLFFTHFLTIAPIVVFVVTWFVQEKSVWSPLDSFGGRLGLAQGVFWILWARPLLVFSRSKVVTAIYLLFVVLPFLSASVLMPFWLNRVSPGGYDTGPMMSGSK